MDVFKGFLIICIVVIHLVLLRDPRSGQDLDIPLFIQAGYLGLMSFFITAGYFYKPERGFLENTKRRLKYFFSVFVVCLIVSPVVMYLWLCLIGQPPVLDDMVESILRGLSIYQLFEPFSESTVCQVCYTTFVSYFLWIMMGSFLLLHALGRFALSSTARFVTVVGILIAIQVIITEFYNLRLPFFMQEWPIGAAFMLFGAFLKDIKALYWIERFEYRSIRFWAPLLLCILGEAVLVVLLPPGNSFDIVKFGDYGGISVVPFFAQSILVFFIYYYLFLLISKIPVLSSVITLEGRHTLGIALTHGLLATMIVSLFYPITDTSWFPPEASTPFMMAVAMVVLVLCTLLCLVWHYFLGRSRNKDMDTDLLSEPDGPAEE